MLMDAASEARLIRQAAGEWRRVAVHPSPGIASVKGIVTLIVLTAIALAALALVAWLYEFRSRPADAAALDKRDSERIAAR